MFRSSTLLLMAYSGSPMSCPELDDRARRAHESSTRGNASAGQQEQDAIRTRFSSQHAPSVGVPLVKRSSAWIETTFQSID